MNRFRRIFMDARNYFSQFIGKEIVRITPVLVDITSEDNGSIVTRYDWLFTEEPVVLSRITYGGEIRYKRINHESIKMRNQEFVMPEYLMDENWCTVEDALKMDVDNPFNEWVGKRIKRICPTPKRGCETFMCDTESEFPPKLLRVGKNHMLVLPAYGKSIILGPDFINQDEWILAE